jgi:hypothetical protein
VKFRFTRTGRFGSIASVASSKSPDGPIRNAKGDAQSFMDPADCDSSTTRNVKSRLGLKAQGRAMSAVLQPVEMLRQAVSLNRERGNEYE